MIIALAQICSSADPVANLALVEQQVAEAAARGAEFVIFPEATMCSFGHRLIDIAEPIDGPWGDRLVEIAAAHDVWVAAGMFTPADPAEPGGRDRVTNTLLVVGRGSRVGYQKIHLFDAYGFRESDTVAAGGESVLVQLGELTVGLTLCYDVRFPGLYTTLADRGAELIVVAASWGAGPGKIDQWQLLTRARALDSTTLVAACGQADPEQAGVDTVPGAPTGVGFSSVIGPDGQLLEQLDAAPGLLVVEVDPGRIAPVREQLPVLVNRRF